MTLKTQQIALASVFISLSAIGGMVKIPLGIASIALDSMPALVAALFLAAPLAGFVAAAGHVLSLYKAGETVKDLVTEDRFDEVTLPDEHAGEALVFRLFEKVSYAIVMKSTKAVNLYDKVKSAE